MADQRTIGERLRAFDEHARQGSDAPENKPENKEPAEGSRETVNPENRVPARGEGGL